MEYVFLKDSNLSESNIFLSEIQKETNVKWHVFHCEDNGKKSVIRIIRNVIFSWNIFLKRKNITKLILSWQQIYGLLYAFFCRIFHCRKYNKLIVMTFIYNPNQGFKGKIKRWFYKFTISSKYVDKAIVTTSCEQKKYQKIFGVDKFIFIPWGIDPISIDKPKVQEEYIFSCGRSNRDYKFLIDSLKDSDYKLKIACDSLELKNIPSNVEVISNLYGMEMLRTMAGAKCVVIALQNEDIASGQLVYLQASAVHVPIIVTKSIAMSDYADDKINCIIVNKHREELLYALDLLSTNKQMVNELTINAYSKFCESFTTVSLANNVFKVISEVLDL